MVKNEWAIIDFGATFTIFLLAVSEKDDIVLKLSKMTRIVLNAGWSSW